MKSHGCQRPMFVSVEGLNGVGKTETVKNLENMLGYHWEQVSPCFRSAMEVMEWKEDLNARYLLFLSIVLHTSNRVSAALRCGKPVVVDGYIERTRAFHLGMGSSISININHVLERPTLSILLTCEEEERQRRIAKRGRRREIWDDLADRNASAILRRYQQCGFPVVDTTELSIPQVFEEVYSILQLRESGGH